MRLVKYDNKLVVVNGNALEISDNSYIVITTNKKLATLTCGSQSYTLTGDELSHAFMVGEGTYACTATLGETTKSTSVTVTTANVYNVSISLSDVPSEYQEVEYIKSTGTQFIDTNWRPDFAKDIVIKGKCGFATTDRGMLLSSFSGGLPTYLDLELQAGFIFRIYEGADKIAIRVNTTVDRVFDFEVMFKMGNIYAIIDDISATAQTSMTGISSESVLLGTDRAYRFPYGLFGKILVTENDIEKIHFIPCYRKSDRETGMYDTVSETFFTNAGTGSFVAGPDVN